MLGRDRRSQAMASFRPSARHPVPARAVLGRVTPPGTGAGGSPSWGEGQLLVQEVSLRLDFWDGGTRDRCGLRPLSWSCEPLLLRLACRLSRAVGRGGRVAVTQTDPTPHSSSQLWGQTRPARLECGLGHGQTSWLQEPRSLCGVPSLWAFISPPVQWAHRNLHRLSQGLAAGTAPCPRRGAGSARPCPGSPLPSGRRIVDKRHERGACRDGPHGTRDFGRTPELTGNPDGAGKWEGLGKDRAGPVGRPWECLTLDVQRVVVVHFQAQEPGGPGAPKRKASFLRVVKGLWGGGRLGIRFRRPTGRRGTRGCPDGNPPGLWGRATTGLVSAGQLPHWWAAGCRRPRGS